MEIASSLPTRPPAPYASVGYSLRKPGANIRGMRIAEGLTRIQMVYLSHATMSKLSHATQNLVKKTHNNHSHHNNTALMKQIQNLPPI